MTPSQRLSLLIAANRPRVYGGLRGGFELLAGQSTPQHWKRRAAEGLISVRENRSALQAMGVPHIRVGLDKLAAVRVCRMKAAALVAAERNQAGRWRLAAE